MRASKPVRVLIVDDSSLMRQLLTRVLSNDPEIEVVGSAPDPHVARDMIKSLDPDVVTLDVEMPRMDGVAFLRKIMELRPMPVVMISSQTQAGADVTLQALEIGAVDFVAKPASAPAVMEMSEELTTKVKAAGRIRMRSRRTETVAAPKPRPGLNRTSGKMVLIGASTGGVEALKEVLKRMPADAPPILITQHMPERFTAAFAARLNNECAMTISEAQDGEPIQEGHAYIAPGGSRHLELARSGRGYFCRLQEGPPVSGHRPSVDALFHSAARLGGTNLIAAILTGMGKDGAVGMLELRKAGAVTFGQDEETSLVYGMPRAAFEIGAVSRQFPLHKIADAILDACHAPHAGARPVARAG
ncbi:MAG: chemotaxis response regulator protein-glutamate methylesterase [Hyphomicrobiales bacterium]|nr:chemotaxis response regulator protein-glutamate methylesterase [Hyphomicrobiales bacterium]